MNDHTTPSERKATKAPAIVAFAISAAAVTAAATIVTLHIVGTLTVPVYIPAWLAFVAVSGFIICVAWAHRNTKEKK